MDLKCTFFFFFKALLFSRGGKGPPPKPTLFPPLLGRPATEAEAQAAVLQNRRNICRSPQNESKKRVNYPTISNLLLDTTLCACFTPCRGLSTFLPPIRPLLTLYPVICPKTAPFSYHVAYPVLCRQARNLPKKFGWYPHTGCITWYV